MGKTEETERQRIAKIRAKRLERVDAEELLLRFMRVTPTCTTADRLTEYSIHFGSSEEGWERAREIAKAYGLARPQARGDHYD